MARERIENTRAGSLVGEFFTGFATLFRGFGWWRRRPDLMLLGLVPAVIVAAVLVGVVLLLATFAPDLVALVTPFADAWDPVWAQLFRVAIAIALVIGVALLLVFSFTALTLLIGDWFYERIWRDVEQQLGAAPTDRDTSFWRGVGDSLRLVLRAILTSVLLALLGLVPVVGTALAIGLGFVLSGRILAAELTTRPLESRGLDLAQRRGVLGTKPARVTGFGLAVQLCFLVPGGAILVMPAAVAGATHLARDLIEALPPRG